MKSFTAALLLLSAFAFSACSKKSTPTPKGSQWQWASYFLADGSVQPRADSTVILFLNDDSTFKIRINDSLLSAGTYRITPDSQMLYFSIPALVYPSGIRLFTACSPIVSKDTLTLLPPLMGPSKAGIFIFVKPVH